MPQLRVALRADASPVIGLGHVKRCLSLAAALLNAGAQVRIVVRDLGIDLAVAANLPGVERVVLPAPAAGDYVPDEVAHSSWAQVGWRRDALETAQRLRDWRPDWIVVDHYSFDARWHGAVRAELGARIAAIDDLADRDLDVDLLIDHNFHPDHRAKYRGRVAAATPILGGPRHALLSPAYAAVSAFQVHREVRSIGIFMGGVDANDFSSIALRACRQHLGFDGAIEIATTRACPHRERLEQLVAKWPNTKLTYDQPHLVDFFARHDLQIGAGGGAVWERCCVGVPTLGLLAAENQRTTLPALAMLGAIAVLADDAAVEESTVADAVRNLLVDVERRSELSKRSHALVDGRGAERVALRLAARCLSVRAATIADARMMHDWRNHPATRQMSNDPREIDWARHVQWLQRALGDPRRCVLVGRVGAVDVGVIRFDLRADQQAEVSLYLDPALHGLGLGRELLLQGEAHLRGAMSALSGFVATVLPGNDASRRMFESCGYVFESGVGHKLPHAAAQSIPSR